MKWGWGNVLNYLIFWFKMYFVWLFSTFHEIWVFCNNFHLILNVFWGSRFNLVLCNNYENSHLICFFWVKVLICQWTLDLVFKLVFWLVPCIKVPFSVMCKYVNLFLPREKRRRYFWIRKKLNQILRLGEIGWNGI